MNDELNWQVAEKVMGERYLGKNVPDYSSSLDAAWLMEEEIAQRKLIRKYVFALEDIVWSAGRSQQAILDEWPSPHELWQLIHATPEQRCRAALSICSANELEAIG